MHQNFKVMILKNIMMRKYLPLKLRKQGRKTEALNFKREGDMERAKIFIIFIIGRFFFLLLFYCYCWCNSSSLFMKIFPVERRFSTGYDSPTKMCPPPLPRVGLLCDEIIQKIREGHSGLEGSTCSFVFQLCVVFLYVCLNRSVFTESVIISLVVRTYL